MTNLITLLLAWNYPTNELSTNTSFHVYSKTNIVQTNWTLLSTVTATGTLAKVQVPKSEIYFKVSASNVWGESFSEVLPLPAPPRQDIRVTIQVLGTDN